VIPRSRRVGRQKEHVGQIVAIGELKRLEVQHRRHQHDAVERHPVLLQHVAGERGGARRAVTFTHQKEWRVPSLVAIQIEPDEFTHRGGVALQAKILFQQFRLGDAAIAGAHRIDEHKIGLGEPRILVVFHLIGRGGHGAVRLLHMHGARTNRAEMQPYGSRPRTAVEGEHHRALAIALPLWLVERIGHEEDVGFRLALVVLQRHQANRRCIVQRLPIHVQHVVRLDRRHFGLRLVLDRLLRRMLLRSWPGCVWMLGEQWCGNRKQPAAQYGTEQATMQMSQRLGPPRRGAISAIL
jgi:hypothetical protein